MTGKEFVCSLYSLRYFTSEAMSENIILLLPGEWKAAEPDYPFPKSPLSQIGRKADSPGPLNSTSSAVGFIWETEPVKVTDSPVSFTTKYNTAYLPSAGSTTRHCVDGKNCKTAKRIRTWTRLTPYTIEQWTLTELRELWGAPPFNGQPSRIQTKPVFTILGE